MEGQQPSRLESSNELKVIIQPPRDPVWSSQKWTSATTAKVVIDFEFPPRDSSDPDDLQASQTADAQPLNSFPP